VVAGAKSGDARADLAHDARALVAEDRREQALGVVAREREPVGVADARGLDLDEDLAGLRPFEVDGLDRQGRARFPGDGSTCLHCVAFSLSRSREKAGVRVSAARHETPPP
jgi:hypothetical protein